MGNQPERILYKRFDRYLSEVREWKTPVKCEKPIFNAFNGALETIAYNQSFIRDGRTAVADIYKVGTAKVGYFNFHDNMFDQNGNSIYGMSVADGRLDALPSDQWYKISLEPGKDVVELGLDFNVPFCSQHNGQKGVK